MSNEKIRTHTEWHSAQRELLSNYWRLKASMALIKCENGRMERYDSEKKRVNPPIGAIKDRLIGGLAGKAKFHFDLRRLLLLASLVSSVTA